MKKLSSIITTVTALALITTACNISLNPPAAPPGPPPGQPQPGQPQPGQSQPGQPGPEQPQPGQPQPGQPQPERPQSGQPQPGQPQPGQPQPGQPPQPPMPQGPQPGQPPAPAQPTATKKSGGSKPAVTPTATLPVYEIIQIDLEATDLYVDSGNYLHAGVKNNSSESGDISFGVTCTGTFISADGLIAGPVSYSNQSVTAAFNANQERWTNTGIQLDKGAGTYNLTCTASVMLDSNSSNNSVTKTLTITP